MHKINNNKFFTAPIEGTYLFYWTDGKGETHYLKWKLKAGEMFEFPENFKAPFGGGIIE